MEFVVIDLKSQAAAIASYARGWSNREFLDWLARFGQVFQIPHQENYYGFKSHSGIPGGFTLSEDGRLTIPNIPVKRGSTTKSFYLR